jgi:hypothetical protein
MLSARHSFSSAESIALLNCRRLPARLNVTEAAILLGFKEHDIAPLIAVNLLVPLGKPAANAPKYFASVDIETRSEDRDWLAAATKVIAKYWRQKNHRAKSADVGAGSREKRTIEATATTL